MLGWVLGGAAALGLGYVAFHKKSALELLNFQPWTAQKGKLFRFTVLAPTASEETILEDKATILNMWLQQTWFLAPKGLPTLVRDKIIVPAPTKAMVALWEVDAVPLWPSFAEPQTVSVSNYGEKILANWRPGMTVTTPRDLAAMLFQASIQPWTANERRFVVFTGARPLATPGVSLSGSMASGRAG